MAELELVVQRVGAPQRHEEPPVLAVEQLRADEKAGQKKYGSWRSGTAIDTQIVAIVTATR